MKKNSFILSKMQRAYWRASDDITEGQCYTSSSLEKAQQRTEGGTIKRRGVK